MSQLSDKEHGLKETYIHMEVKIYGVHGKGIIVNYLPFSKYYDSHRQILNKKCV